MTQQAIQTTESRVRRSADQVKAARLEREQRLHDKAAARAKRFASMAQKAAEKAAVAAAKSKAIEANVAAHREKAPMPVIQETVVNRIAREISAFMKELGVKHDLAFDEITPRLTRRGSGFSAHISGHVSSMMVAAKHAVGATREATRFMQNHKLIGVKPSILGKEVQLAGEVGSFKVLGLKGRANAVLLQKVGSEEIRAVPAEEFKAHMVSA